MEVVITDLTYNNIFNNFNISFKPNKINFIISNNYMINTTLLNLAYLLDTNFTGTLKIGKDKLTKYSTKNYYNKVRGNIFYIPKDYKKMFINTTILDDIICLAGTIKEKIYDALMYFNLDSAILSKSYYELSNGELKKIILVCMILSDSNLILIDEPTLDLDYKSEEALIKVIKRIKREDKCIIISSTNTNFILKLADEIYLINGEKAIEYNNKYDLLCSQEIMTYCGLNIPKIVEFRNIALNKKGIKLLYRDNINDLLKDIYRNAN